MQKTHTERFFFVSKSKSNFINIQKKLEQDIYKNFILGEKNAKTKNIIYSEI
jgi:hypothetical protein